MSALGQELLSNLALRTVRYAPKADITHGKCLRLIPGHLCLDNHPRNLLGQ